MFRKLRTYLFGPFASSVVHFLALLQESCTYLRKQRFQVISTELPDALLKKWLMPIPGEADADEYMRNFAGTKDTLSEIQLPVFVFDYVLRKRFNRDIATFDKTQMETAGDDLRIYILLLNYISGIRKAGRPLIEFDIFDVENYAAIMERIEAQEAAPNSPTGQAWLSDAEITALRSAIFNDLTDGYIDEI